MAATEKIGGVELSTYGLRLARLDGNVDLPPFKNIIDQHNFESNLQILDEHTVKIKLIGFYASRSAMGLAISQFQTKIKSATKQVWEFTNHGFSKTCVLNHGFHATYYATAVEITLTLTITSS